MGDYGFFMETITSLIELLICFGLTAVVIYMIAKAIPQNGDPAKRSVLTIFGNPMNVLVKPFEETAVGYIEVPYEMLEKMPVVKIETKSSPPTQMTIEDMSFTLRISKKNPRQFLASGGKEVVIKEAIGMFTSGLQEFSANNTRFVDVESMKKAQPYMLAAILNYITRGDAVDMTDERAIRKAHDLMASKHGEIEIPSLGVTLVQMDIGRVVEPKEVVEANTAIAEQERKNAEAKVKIKGVAERLKILQKVDSTVTLETLQIQENIRPADERKITVSGATDSDRTLASIIAVADAFGRSQQQGKKK